MSIPRLLTLTIALAMTFPSAWSQGAQPVQIATLSDSSSLINPDFGIYHGTLTMANLTDSVIASVNFDCPATIPSSGDLFDVAAGATRAILIYNSTISAGCIAITGYLKTSPFKIGTDIYTTTAPNFGVQIQPGSNVSGPIIIQATKVDVKSPQALITQVLATVRANNPLLLHERDIANLAFTALVDARHGYYGLGQFDFLKGADPVALSNADHFMQSYAAGTGNTLADNPLTAAVLGGVVDPVYNLCKSLTNNNCFKTDNGAQSPANFDFWALQGAEAGIGVQTGISQPPDLQQTQAPVSTDGQNSVFVEQGNGPFPLDPAAAPGYEYKVLAGPGFSAIAVPSQSCLSGVQTASLSYGNVNTMLPLGQTHTFSPAVTDFTIQGLGVCSAGFVADVTFAGSTTDISVISQTALNPPLSSFQSPVSVTPAAGTGSTQTMAFSFMDLRGSQDLGVLNILINNALDGRHACYLAYSRPSNVLYLVDDAGASLLAGASLRSAGTIGNSQCTVSWDASAVSAVGHDLSLTLTITFKTAFAGNKVIYLAARDVAENNSGWQPLGVWQVSGGAQATSTSVSGMGPAHGRGSAAPETVTFTFADTKGVQDLGVENILINSSIDGRQACYLAYARPINTLFLVSDVGDALLPGRSLGAADSLSNSQCTVNWASNPVTSSGNTLALTLDISFSAAFDGNRVVYLAARDTREGNNTDWQAAGTRTVQ